MSPCPLHINTVRCYDTVCCYQIAKVDIYCKRICSLLSQLLFAKTKQNQQKGRETKQIQDLWPGDHLREVAQLAAIEDHVQSINNRSHISDASSSSLTSQECGVRWEIVGRFGGRQPSSLFGHIPFLQDDLSLPGGQLGLVIAQGP